MVQVLIIGSNQKLCLLLSLTSLAESFPILKSKICFIRPWHQSRFELIKMVRNVRADVVFFFFFKSNSVLFTG